MKVKSLSRVRLLVTPWTAAYQAPPPMGFSRQEYWSGVPSPSPDSSMSSQKKMRGKWIGKGKEGQAVEGLEDHGTEAGITELAMGDH